jgi:hypothetical protein
VVSAVVQAVSTEQHPASPEWAVIQVAVVRLDFPTVPTRHREANRLTALVGYAERILADLPVVVPAMVVAEPVVVADHHQTQVRCLSQVALLFGH